MSASGSSASRKRSWATTRFAADASTSVPRKTMRSRRSREKMSNERSKRPSDSTTIGTRWFDTLLIGCTSYATRRLRDGGRAGDRRTGDARRGVGGADGAGAARGVVRVGGRARRPARRRGGLPLGRRRRASGCRPRVGGGKAPRARLGRRRDRRDRARGIRGRDARACRGDLAGDRSRPRAARAVAGSVGGRAADARREDRAARGGAGVDGGHGGVDRVFAALGDAGRRSLIETVATRGTATATELAAELPVTRQAVAKQLSALADAGLLRATRSGRETRYEVTPAPLEEAVEWMVSVGTAWDERLAALRRSLGGYGKSRSIRQAPDDSRS